MNRYLVALLLILVFSAAGSAQALLPKANVFVGYSYNNFDLSQGIVRGHSLNGWNASGEMKALPFLGIVGDVSGHYGNATGIGPLCPAPACSGSTNVSIHEYNVLFGPRVSFSVRRLRPFAHALFGGAHVSSGTASDTSFATALGGGVDWRLRGPLAWRFQGDYLQTRFFSQTQNNSRMSTGLVLRF